MEILVFLLPALIGLTMAALLATTRNKTLAQEYLITMLVVFSGFFICDACIVFHYTPATLVLWSYILMSFFVVAIPITTIFLVWALITSSQKSNRWFILVYIIPGIVLLLELINYTGLGFDKALDYMAHGYTIPYGLDSFEINKYRIFSFVAIKFLAIISEIEQIGCVLLLLWTFWYTDLKPRAFLRWLFKIGPIRPINLIAMVCIVQIMLFAYRAYWGGAYFAEHQGIYAFMSLGSSLCVLFLGFIGFALKKPCLYLGNKHHPQPRFADMPVAITDAESIRFHKGKVCSEMDDLESDTYKTLNLRDELQVLMADGVFYLQPGLSSYSLSSALGVSRHGLENLIRILYHVSYQEYVAIQRCAYVRRYYAVYSGEDAVEVAMHCGFINVRQMNLQLKNCQIFMQPFEKVHLM